MTERHWNRFSEIMDDEELRDNPEYDSHEKRSARMEEVDARIEAWTRTRERDELADVLLDRGVPCAPVKERDEVLFDPHLEERNMVNEIDHPDFGQIRVPGLPIRPHASSYPDIRPAPSVGEHTKTVLRALGKSAEEIEELEADGII